MPCVQKSALVPYSDQLMFDLVKDIDRYADFLPWCGDSVVLSETPEQVCGRLTVERLGVRQAFSTCNHLAPPERISIDLQEGPFQSLQGAWEFVPLRENACKVTLKLDFAFSGHLINVAFGKAFEQIANTMVDAFCQRAKVVYGKGVMP